DGAGRPDQRAVPFISDAECIQLILARGDFGANAERLVGCAVRIDENDDLTVDPGNAAALPNDAKFAPDRGRLPDDAFDLRLRAAVFGMRHLKDRSERRCYLSRFDAQKIIVPTRPLHLAGT